MHRFVCIYVAVTMEICAIYILRNLPNDCNTIILLLKICVFPLLVAINSKQNNLQHGTFDKKICMRVICTIKYKLILCKFYIAILIALQLHGNRRLPTSRFCIGLKNIRFIEKKKAIWKIKSNIFLLCN